MRSKKLLFSSLLSLGAIATYIVFTSSANASQGVMGASTVGCGTCHGSASAATSINVTGIPGTGFVPGTAYNLVLSVTNGSKLAAGFDLSVTAGTISNAPANTMLMGGTELHHTAPLAMASGVSTWNFTWTAPATGNSATIYVAGNAVNNNNGDSGDQWNKVSLTFNKAIPAQIEDVNDSKISLFPNPASNTLILKTTTDVQVSSIQAVSMNGSKVSVTSEKMNDGSYKVNIDNLATGNYILTFLANGKMQHTAFQKN